MNLRNSSLESFLVDGTDLYLDKDTYNSTHGKLFCRHSGGKYVLLEGEWIKQVNILKENKLS